MIQELIDGINNKKRAPWRELYNHFYAPLCSYSYRITNNSQASEDIVQDILIKLWYSKTTFDDAPKLKSYLFKAVYSRSLNHKRDNKNITITNQELTDFDHLTEENYIKMAIEEDALNQFYKVLEKLPTQQREIILLALKGDKNEEIATKLNVSINTIKTQKKRAYTFLRENLSTSLLFAVIFSLIP